MASVTPVSKAGRAQLSCSTKNTRPWKGGAERLDGAIGNQPGGRYRKRMAPSGDAQVNDVFRLQAGSSGRIVP